MAFMARPGAKVDYSIGTEQESGPTVMCLTTKV